jgi:hypothetical protein
MLTFLEFQSKLQKLVEIAMNAKTLNQFVEEIIDNEGKTFSIFECVVGDIAGVTLPIMGIKRTPPTTTILNPAALKFIKDHVKTFRNRFTGEESDEILKVLASVMQERGKFNGEKK